MPLQKRVVKRRWKKVERRQWGHVAVLTCCNDPHKCASLNTHTHAHARLRVNVCVPCSITHTHTHTRTRTHTHSFNIIGNLSRFQKYVATNSSGPLAHQQNPIEQCSSNKETLMMLTCLFQTRWCHLSHKLSLSLLHTHTLTLQWCSFNLGISLKWLA